MCVQEVCCLCVQKAKEMVLELLAEKDGMPPSGGMGTFNNFDGMGGGPHGGGGGGMEVRNYFIIIQT